MPLDFIARVKSWNRERLKRHRARKHDARAQLAVMGIVKNEELNIAEWIEHYQWQGADHIFLIDNGSTDSTRDIIRRYGNVTLLERPEPHRQVEHYRWAYTHCQIRKRFNWLLIADADEFWFCKEGGRVADALERFPETSVIYCNWSIFGGGGEKHPKSLRAELTLRQACHDHSKWVARTDALRDSEGINIHRVHGADSGKTLTDYETFQLNHYMTQSREFWETAKMARGDVYQEEWDRRRGWAEFDDINSKCDTVDDTLARQVIAAAPSRPRK